MDSTLSFVKTIVKMRLATSGAADARNCVPDGTRCQNNCPLLPLVNSFCPRAAYRRMPAPSESALVGGEPSGFAGVDEFLEGVEVAALDEVVDGGELVVSGGDDDVLR